MNNKKSKNPKKITKEQENKDKTKIQNTEEIFPSPSPFKHFMFIFGMKAPLSPK